MAIDFGLGLRALQTFGEEASRGQQMEAQQQQMQRQQYGFQQQQRQDTARTGYADQARAGDFAGARQGAALGGDFDFANALGGLQDDHLKQLAREFDTIGVLHPQLKGIPVEQRAQIALPILRQAGFSDQELAGVDWSDAGLDGAFAMSQSGKAALAARMKQQEARVVGDGGALVNGAGQVLYENQKAPEWQFDGESGSWLQKPGTGQNGGQPGGYTPQGAMPQMGGGGPLSAMTAITAQSESGNRDYLPNGQLVTSSAGAQGAMQTMPTTQSDPGYGVAPVRDGSVGEKNRVGREYLAAMVQKYGDPQKAWAAYNAGPGRVDQAIQRHGENWLAALPSETRNYVAKNSAQLGGGQQSAPSQPGVINVRPPRSQKRDAPSGYEWNGESLRPIRGGPADPATATSKNVQSNRKAEADFRKEFHQLQEVKDFNKARTQFNSLRTIAMNPKATAQDDIAVIFSFMKTLDPTSTVREGEFATAQNAAGVPDAIRNAYVKALNGERLNTQQRTNMVRTAYQGYKAFRDAYNTQAENYRGYARDNGISPDRVARTYTPDKPAAKAPPAARGLKTGETRKIGRFTVTAVN
jgi:hypothetical protein